MNDFISQWDEWLQHCISTSRRQLGDEWLPIYLNSPMWRFGLAPDVCGENAWAGLLVPSVDKVGRYFPLTFACALKDSEPISSIFAASGWYDSLEQVALSALTVDYSTDQLEKALQERPFPKDARAPENGEARQIGAWLRERHAVPTAVHLSGSDAIAGAMASAGNEIIRAATAQRSFWWSVSDDTHVTEVHCCVGLPPPDYYRVLLTGDHPTDPAVSDSLRTSVKKSASDP